MFACFEKTKFLLLLCFFVMLLFFFQTVDWVVIMHFADVSNRLVYPLANAPRARNL